MWQCGDCGAVDGRGQAVVEVVCHHCGKPLCGVHRIQLLDEAFGDGDGPAGRNAYHCGECRQAFHRTRVVAGFR